MMTNRAGPTVGGVLQDAIVQLKTAGVEMPELDARLLLQEAVGLSHADIIADGARGLGAEAVAGFAQMMARRLAHEPVSRIVGRRAFWGLDLAVSASVLDPRADTERLIEAVLERVAETGRMPGRIADIGTGSGAIVLALLSEFPKATAVASDICDAALEVAQANAENLGLEARIEFVRGSCLEPLVGTYDLIVSNPPYIRSADIAGLSEDVRQFDPLLALDGGADGLDFYRVLVSESQLWLKPDGALFVEIGHDQATDVCQIADECGWNSIEILKDMAENDRVLCLSR